jgi:hypothetical protein
MYEQVQKPKENKSRAVANSVGQKKSNVRQGFRFENNRQEAWNQNEIQRKIENSPTQYEGINTNNRELIVQRTSWSWVEGTWVAQDEDEPQTAMPDRDGAYDWETIDTGVVEDVDVAQAPLPEGYVSPYMDQINKYDSELNGAVVRVEDNFVVIVEHYQLKHNPDLGILHAGGPFKGKKGSSLAGGWEAHTNEYSVQILNAARDIIAGLEEDVALPIILEKQRLDSIDAYISISKDGLDWIINYHGNPPD